MIELMKLSEYIKKWVASYVLRDADCELRGVGYEVIGKRCRVEGIWL